MVTSILYFRIGVFIYLVAIVTVSGQDASQTPSIQQAPQPGPAQQTSEQYQATLQAFQREQLALMREKQALVKQGATDQQLTAWQQQNTARLSAQAQQAQAIAAGAVSQPVPVNAKPNIPADASPTLRDFLTTQAALANARAQIHNQSLQATSSSRGGPQDSQMQSFQQQHAGDLQLQLQRAQSLSDAAAQTPLMVPKPRTIPSDATPELIAYMTLRDQLMRERIQVRNQYISADPAALEAALQQWRQQNAERIQQLSQKAQNLAQTNVAN